MCVGEMDSKHYKEHNGLRQLNTKSETCWSPKMNLKIGNDLAQPIWDTDKQTLIDDWSAYQLTLMDITEAKVS